MVDSRSQAEIAATLLVEMDLAAFRCRDDDTFEFIGESPRWVGRFVHTGDALSAASQIIERFAFLRDFLQTAHTFWSCHPSGRIKSGWWTETDNAGAECHFEASALLHGDQRVLIVEQLGGDFHERRDLLQKARQARLDSDRLLEHETTERERAQSRADELRAQLAHVGRVGAMGEMAASLAHELNQPLWAVINYVQASMNLLASGADAERIRAALTKAVEQAERAGGILAGLRQFIAEAAPQREAASIRDLAVDVINLLAPDLTQADVRVDLDIADGLPLVIVDGVQVQQVVFNLVRNAIEAMPSDADPADHRIAVHAHAKGRGRVVVAISDTGSGCDDETMQRLCDPFFSTKDGGMGMGLAIARTIVEAHDGALTAHRSDPRGLTLRFDLPVADPSENSHEQGESQTA